MALVKSVRGKSPELGENCYFAENATIVGDVQMGNDCSVWFNAVVRGDVHYIKMGNKVNIQDGAIIHGTYQKAPTSIGDHVSIGHAAIVHGCTLADNVLVGMRSVIMDHARVEPNAIIAAGAVIPENTHVESGSVYAGVPARKLKDIDEEQFNKLVKGIADNYVMYAGWYREASSQEKPDTPHLSI